MNIPFVDLKTQYQGIKEDIKAVIDNVLEECAFVGGPYVKSFEKNFLEVHGAQYGIGCANGTSAITVALRALGVGPGDEVITVTNTFIATVEAIVEVGATPVLVDCDADTYLMTAAKVEEKIGPKTKAIIPVHLYGNACPMDELVHLANRYKLMIVEDCAQAHLCHFDSQAVGTFGEAGTFSFYPGKNLGAYGDAGFVTVNSEDLEKRVRMEIDHGRTSKYEHELSAGNFRMDGLQGAILDVKLKHLKDWTEKRQKWAQRYNQAFIKEGFKVIKSVEKGECVYHLYVIEVANRDEVMTCLQDADIACGIHYPIPLHKQKALERYNLRGGDFSNSERSATTMLSLPIFPELSEGQVDYIIEKFLKIAKRV